jgi:transposase
MLLNLDGLTVVGTQTVGEDTCITVKTDFEPTGCIKCSSILVSQGFYSHGSRVQFFHDSPIHGNRVALKIERKRFKCRNCGGTFEEPLSFMHPDHNMTKRLADLITKECYREKFTDVARRTGVTEKTVRNIFREHVDHLRKRYKFETPEVLGIDEIHIRTPRAVFTNLREKTIIEMLPGRTKAEVTAFLLSLDRSKVKLVSTDMWQPYRDACAVAFPSAKHVVDRFHVQKMANEVMTRIRVKAVSDLSKADKRRVKQNKFLLLSRNFNLNEAQQEDLLQLVELCPILGYALEAKERFMDIWTAQDRTTAEHMYLTWKKGLSEELKPDFKPITTAFKNWHVEIFNWWDYGITNAFTESLNDKIREIHRGGRGYSFEVLRAKIICKAGLHKTKAIPEKFDKSAFDAFTYHKTILTPLRENYGIDISKLLALKDLDSD